MSCAGSGPSALARTGPRGPAFRADDGPMLALQKEGCTFPVSRLGRGADIGALKE